MSMKLQFRRTDEDVGHGPVKLRFRPNAHSIAMACPNNSVIYYDKRGNIIDALDLPGKAVDIAWDKEGDCLAVAVENSSIITLWDVNSRATEAIESSSVSSREFPTCLAWSKTSLFFASGNNVGNLFIYNHKTARKVSLMGKHQRAITNVVFTPDDMIITCSDDSSITVSNVEGDTVSTCNISGEPTHLSVGIVSKPGSKNQTMLSCILNKKILMLAQIDGLDDPINLQFQERYGNIRTYSWFNNGSIAVGFDRGFLVTISAQHNELGSEISSIPEFKTYLGAVCTNQSFSKILSAGDHQIKIREMDQFGDVYAITEVDTDKDLNELTSTDDGQMVAVSSLSGAVSVYVTKMPSMASAYQNIVAYLSGLTQITIVSETERKLSTVLEIGLEPSFIGLGPTCVAVASSNRVYFYDYTLSAMSANPTEKPLTVTEPLTKVDYLSSVTDVQLNQKYAIVTAGGKLRLHTIQNSEEDESMTFPESSRNARLLATALTDDFLIFTTDTNYIVYFSLSEWAIVAEYRHSSSIRNVYPHPADVICCCFDERLESLIYSPIDDGMLKLPPIGSAVHYKGAFWETFTIDRDTFAVYDQQNIYVFLMTKRRIEGESVVFVGSTKLPHAHAPLIMHKGIVKCLLPNGRIGTVLLDSHRTDNALTNKSNQQMTELLNRALLMQRWNQAWKICEQSKQLSHWNMFAHAALLDSDVVTAIRIFRHIGDVAMVQALERIECIDEKNLLSAHVAVILGRYDEAERLFELSSQPIEALHMRRDLLEWPKALALAERLDPSQIPLISKEYAQELELIGDDANALINYEKGMIDTPNDSIDVQEHNEVCASGIARMSIKTGDLRRGIQMAKDIEGRVVKRDCAIILEQLKQYTEAAQLYEIGLFYDRAAAVCLKANAWGKVGELLDKVKSPKIHIQYGKVMEKERNYKQAAMCYERGRDNDNLVRVLLEHLNMPEEAVRIVRESRSIEGAKLVAQFFSRLGDNSSAIQFLVMSQCYQEAFDVAEKYDCIDDYADALDQYGSGENAIELADYFLSIADQYNAARFFFKGAQYQTALQLLMKLGDRNDALLLATDCAIKANDKSLTDELIRHLIGDGADGTAKNPSYLFRLYVGLGMIREASKTAVIVSQAHQTRGSYRIARDVLFQMFLKLSEKQMKIPLEMSKSLMVIHSYMIVKPLIARKETLMAARMLIRTCDNISKFPSHIVQILTSSVIICTQANLRRAAHKYATILMKPEYRSKIHEKYKKKIEDIVRRGGKDNEDPPENKTPCPFCDQNIDETQLTCSFCKTAIPYCLITGRHVISSDFCLCSSCQMPAYFTEFKKLAAIGEKCTLCGGDANGVIPADFHIYMDEQKKQKD